MRRFGLLLVCAGAVAAQDAVDNVFSVWDMNKDGVLTADEVPDAAIFAKVDQDQDGKITREEVAAFFRVKPEPKAPPAAPPEKGKTKEPPKPPEKKTEEAPIQEPRTIKERVADLFRRFDRNKDRKIQRDEFQGAGDEVWKKYDRTRDDALNEREATRYVKDTLREAKRRPNVNNFFDLFDMNRDKKVTSGEYDGPGDFFRRYDHDKDHVITQEELNMGPDMGGMRPGDEEFLGDGPTREPERGLLERYDKDGDGKLTLEELNKAESVMRRLDRNGDGILSGAEVR